MASLREKKAKLFTGITYLSTEDISYSSKYDPSKVIDDLVKINADKCKSQGIEVHIKNVKTRSTPADFVMQKDVYKSAVDLLFDNAIKFNK